MRDHSNSQKVAMIANPMAGVRSSPRLVERALRELQGYEVETYIPSTAEELQSLCSQFRNEDYSAAVVFGGDGTQNHALRGRWLLGEAQAELAPLYPFPGGTANDLSAELGILPSFYQLQNLLDRQECTSIDVVSVNGVPFSTVAGIGVGAGIAQTINDSRQGSRLMSNLIHTLRSEVYTAMSAKAILTSRGFLQDVRIEADGFSERLHVAAAFICNQNTLGGGLTVGDQNSNRDGVFGVLIVPAKSPLCLLKDLAALKMGRTPRGSIRLSTSQLTITSEQNREISVFGDGEVLLQAKRLNFAIHPKALPVFSSDL